MMILVVFTTILSLLASWTVTQQVNAQGPVEFNFPLFDSSTVFEFNVLHNASINTGQEILKITNPADSWCTTHVCRGQIVYSNGIDLINRSSHRTYSFSTSFVFSLTSPRPTARGEGFAFFLISNPFQNEGNGVGYYFGAFPPRSQASSPTVAVEFDVLKNAEVGDVDDNHVGVDFNNATSAAQESCYVAGISLYDGQKIQAWIDYHDSIKRLQVRLAYWTASVMRVTVKPAAPLIDLSVDLATLVDDTMYVGFTGETYTGHEQETAVYSWSFRSEIEVLPPPSPKSNESALNISAPRPPSNQPRANNTRSKERDLILGSAIGGGLGVIIALGGCFWLGYYCSKKKAKATKEEEDHRKKSLAAGYAADTEEDTQSTKLVSQDVESGPFGTVTFEFAPLSQRTNRSISRRPPADNDPTLTALRRGTEKSMPTRTRSARELQAAGVEADAIKKGLLDIEVVTSVNAPDRRRIQSFAISGNPEFVNITMPGRASQTRTDYPSSRVSPGTIVPQTEEGGLSIKKPVNRLTSEKKVVSPTSALPAVTGDGRGDDADSGTSDSVYQITAIPVPLPGNMTGKSHSFNERSSVASSPPADRRHFLRIPSFEINATRSWDPQSSDGTRELEVVLKRGEAIRSPRKPDSTASERSYVSTLTKDIDNNWRQSRPEETPPASPPAGTIMFTNTLFDSPQDQDSPESSPSRKGTPEPEQESPYMGDEIYGRLAPEIIYDYQTAAADYGDEIVERVFDVPSRNEAEDVDEIFDNSLSSPMVLNRDVTITSLNSSPVDTPAPSPGGSKRHSRTTTPSRARPAAGSTSSTVGASSSADARKVAEDQRVKSRRPHWK